MQTLYQRIGGGATIENLVNRFYARVLADPELAPFFVVTSMEKLRAMQKAFFTAALDGPSAYSGLSLAVAHQNRGIERSHLSKFTGHLLDTLKEVGIGDEETNQIVSRIGMLADDVLGDTTVDG